MDKGDLFSEHVVVLESLVSVPVSRDRERVLGGDFPFQEFFQHCLADLGVFPDIVEVVDF